MPWGTGGTEQPRARTVSGVPVPDAVSLLVSTGADYHSDKNYQNLLVLLRNLDIKTRLFLCTLPHANLGKDEDYTFENLQKAMERELEKQTSWINTFLIRKLGYTCDAEELSTFNTLESKTPLTLTHANDHSITLYPWSYYSDFPFEFLNSLETQNSSAGPSSASSTSLPIGTALQHTSFSEAIEDWAPQIARAMRTLFTQRDWPEKPSEKPSKKNGAKHTVRMGWPNLCAPLNAGDMLKTEISVSHAQSRQCEVEGQVAEFTAQQLLDKITRAPLEDALKAVLKDKLEWILTLTPTHAQAFVAHLKEKIAPDNPVFSMITENLYYRLAYNFSYIVSEYAASLTISLHFPNATLSYPTPNAKGIAPAKRWFRTASAQSRAPYTPQNKLMETLETARAVQLAEKQRAKTAEDLQRTATGVETVAADVATLKKMLAGLAAAKKQELPCLIGSDGTLQITLIDNEDLLTKLTFGFASTDQTPVFTVATLDKRTNIPKTLAVNGAAHLNGSTQPASHADTQAFLATAGLGAAPSPVAQRKAAGADSAAPAPTASDLSAPPADRSHPPEAIAGRQKFGTFSSAPPATETDSAAPAPPSRRASAST